jgi:hypothetical protein
MTILSPLTMEEIFEAYLVRFLQHVHYHLPPTHPHIYVCVCVWRGGLRYVGLICHSSWPYTHI